jgi:SAM-dependent methyltransferase
VVAAVDAHPDTGALAAYEAVAPAYEVLTDGYAHEPWLAAIEELALRLGARRGRVLDVACGTGRSFVPLLRRGWDVTACDLSPAMARRARAAAGGAAEVHVADMRALPDLGAFDLVTCLDDAVNYLLDEGDLRAALAGFARSLAPGGIAIWDVNTLLMHRSAFATDWVAEGEGALVAWQGRTDPGLPPGGIAEAQVDAFTREGAGWSRRTGVHRQRHWPVAGMTAHARAAGLELVDVLGQHRGARLERPAVELVHRKALFAARAS